MEQAPCEGDRGGMALLKHVQVEKKSLSMVAFSRSDSACSALMTECWNCGLLITQDFDSFSELFFISWVKLLEVT